MFAVVGALAAGGAALAAGAGAATAIGAAGLGLAAGSALGGARAADKAADAQTQAINQATGTEWDMYRQSRADQLPWLEAGTQALGDLSAMISGGPGTTVSYGGGQQPIAGSNIMATDPRYSAPASTRGMPPRTDTAAAFGAGAIPQRATAAGGGVLGGVVGSIGQSVGDASLTPDGQGRTVTTQSFEKSPYYQMGLSEQEKAIDRYNASRGTYASGKGAVDLQKNALANMVTNRGNWVNEWLSTKLNPTQTLAGVGQSTGSQMATNAMQTGQSIGQNQMAAGQARASGYINQANALTGGIQSGLDAYGMYRGFQRPQAPQKPSYLTGSQAIWS